MTEYMAAIGFMFSVSAVCVLGAFGLVFWLGPKIDAALSAQRGEA